ncbi:MAG: hypothetical protein V2J65_20695 [Desulfobacteraceae bacterium]|nr:hypothetical protein [Desulfobacteraceae bacterium]
MPTPSKRYHIEPGLFLCLYEKQTSATAQKSFLRGIGKKEAELQSITGQLETAKEELKIFDNKIHMHAQFKARDQQVQQ